MRNHVHGTCLRRDRQAQHSQVTGWGARYSLSSEAGGPIILQPKEINQKGLVDCQNAGVSQLAGVVGCEMEFPRKSTAKVEKL